MTANAPLPDAGGLRQCGQIHAAIVYMEFKRSRKALVHSPPRFVAQAVVLVDSGERRRRLDLPAARMHAGIFAARVDGVEQLALAAVGRGDILWYRVLFHYSPRTVHFVLSPCAARPVLFTVYDGQVHEAAAEAAALWHIAQQPLAGLQTAGLQQLVDHDVHRRRAGVAFHGEIGEPALEGNIDIDV